jgi:hypothetical protein
LRQLALLAHEAHALIVGRAVTSHVLRARVHHAHEARALTAWRTVVIGAEAAGVGDPVRGCVVRSGSRVRPRGRVAVARMGATWVAVSITTFVPMP